MTTSTKENQNLKRDTGFYWVEYNGSWIVAEWDKYRLKGIYPDRWLIPGNEDYLSDGFFNKIDERPLFYDHKIDREGEKLKRKNKNHFRFKK